MDKKSVDALKAMYGGTPAISPEAKEQIEQQKAQFDQEQKDKDFALQRLGRITGSQFDKIKFKAPSKTAKIKYIKERGKGAILERFGKSPKSLTLAQIDPIYKKVAQDTDYTMSGATESYLYDKLLAEQILQAPNRANKFSSRATQHGKEHESEGIAFYANNYLPEDMPNFTIQPNEKLFINPAEPLWGSTPDAVILEGDKIKGVFELKCPYNTGNHAKFLRTSELDSRYTNQRLGYFVNLPKVNFVVFATYEPNAATHEKKMHYVILWRYEVAKQIEAFRSDLIRFTNIYKQACEEMGIAAPITSDTFKPK